MTDSCVGDLLTTIKVKGPMFLEESAPPTVAFSWEALNYCTSNVYANSSQYQNTRITDTSRTNKMETEFITSIINFQHVAAAIIKRKEDESILLKAQSAMTQIHSEQVKKDLEVANARIKALQKIGE